MTPDRKLYSPSVGRNREPIRDVVRRYLPQDGFVLEFASGTGEHVNFLAQSSDPRLIFQPSDPDPIARASIDAWTSETGLANVLPAIALDAEATTWPVTHADTVICINMIHIAPWSATVGLVRGASRVLKAGGILFLYGPFRRGGRHTSESNERFDVDLRTRDPAWGVRDLEAVAALAASCGFAAPIIEPMPANNLSLVFRLVS